MAFAIKAFGLGAASLIAAAAVPSGAYAQSNDDSWTGPYAGARLGYAFQRKDGDETVVFDTDLNGIFDNTVTTGTGAPVCWAHWCTGAPSAVRQMMCNEQLALKPVTVRREPSSG